MKILVTGSSGFLGSNIVKKLQEINGLDLILTTRSLKEVSKKKFLFDFKDLDFESNLFEYFGKPDIVLHCAWEKVKEINEIKHMDSQVFLHMRFIENMVKNGAKKIVILGSCFEYGKQNGEVNEEQCPTPNTPYASAKDYLRRYVEFLQFDYSFDFQWLRIFYVYDENGESGSNIISSLKKSVLNGDSNFDMSKGEQELDFIEVKDLSNLIVKVILQNKINGIINCCSGIPVKVMDLVKSCLLSWSSTIELNTGKYAYRDFESLNIFGSTKKLDRALRI